MRRDAKRVRQENLTTLLPRFQDSLSLACLGRALAGAIGRSFLHTASQHQITTLQSRCHTHTLTQNPSVWPGVPPRALFPSVIHIDINIGKLPTVGSVRKGMTSAI